MVWEEIRQNGNSSFLSEPSGSTEVAQVEPFDKEGGRS